jgi:uncharacterized protein YcbX
MEFGELNIESLTERFRPNLVLSAGSDVPPYAEEQWEMVRIGKAQFKVKITDLHTCIHVQVHVT